MACLSAIVVALALGSPPAAAVDVGEAIALPAGVAAPIDAGAPDRTAEGPATAADGDEPLVRDPGPVPPGARVAAPLDQPRWYPPPRPDAPVVPAHGASPLAHMPGWRTTPIETPFPPGEPTPAARDDPRARRVVRIDLVLGPVWRVKTTELMSLATVEAGRLQGLSGAFHVGVIVAPDRDFVAAIDVPLGGGVVLRRRFGERPIFGSVGVSGGLLIHRAATERGVVHRVDPDLQVPLRLTWTAGEVGFSLAVVQGFSVRGRTYYRRGAEVWHRIPYRVGLMVGIHFDVGVSRTRSRRASQRSRGLP